MYKVVGIWLIIEAVIEITVVITPDIKWFRGLQHVINNQNSAWA
jgi:hypothetical protein